MKALAKRSTATVVLVICIFGSIFGFGGNYLRTEARNVMHLFQQGDEAFEDIRVSMDQYLDDSAIYAVGMAEELRRYTAMDNVNAARAIELSKLIGDGNDLNARYEAWAELNLLAESMYTEIHAAFPGDHPAETKVFDDYYVNYNGERSKIGYDPYHSSAEAFNRELSGFPAGLVGHVVGVDEMNQF